MKSKRFDFFFVLFLVALGFFSFRLYRYQLVESEKYAREVENISHRSLEVFSTRGTILDRYEVPLAWDGPFYTVKKNVVFLPEDLKKTVVEIFKNESQAETFIRKLEMFGSVEIDLSSTAVERLREYRELEISERIIRYYSENPGLSHVLGYMKVDGEAVMGIEKEYDSFLTGIPGERLIKVDSLGNLISIESESLPTPGEDLVLTIDASMSRFVYDKLEATGKRSAAVVMKTNGEVLALVSAPSFNPNVFSRGISSRNWQRMNLDPSTPLINRAVNPLTPGSVIKPFIAMVALAEGIDTTQEIDCGGSFQYKDSKGVVQGIYRDWLLYGHGRTDLFKAITVSCNIYFYQLGLKLGIENIVNYGKKWELFDPTGIDLPEEGAGVLPSPDWKRAKLDENWFPGDTILTSIGQGYLSITPLQLARMTGEIATEGMEILPYLGVRRVSEKRIIELDEKSWALIVGAMSEVTSKTGYAASAGTASKAFADFQWTSAGKTGTAEQGGSKPTHSWFTGFAPVESPEVVVTVYVYEGGYGSGIATEISREIMDYYFENYAR